MNIKIIHEPENQKPFLVIYKPKGLPSAPLSENDSANALSEAIELFPKLKQVKGRKAIEYGLLHRIDTATDGLLLIAATQDCYDFLLNEQKIGKFLKFYKAKCNINQDNSEIIPGFPLKPDFELKENKIIHIESYFRNFGPGSKEVRPVIKESNKAALQKTGRLKLYSTEIKIEKILNESECLVECCIKEGYRHQVRNHLAWIGLPIIGDELYNCENDKKNAEKQLRFSATKIQFEYPIGDLNSYEITFTWT